MPALGKNYDLIKKWKGDELILDQQMTNDAFIKEVAIQLLPYLINYEQPKTDSDDNLNEIKSTC